ncbi:hypothetical protein N9N03_02930, partial [Chlamydiia bacterium]|nr:hypothetical protein [Chlamydiia bacterium]
WADTDKIELTNPTDLQSSSPDVWGGKHSVSAWSNEEIWMGATFEGVNSVSIIRDYFDSETNELNGFEREREYLTTVAEISPWKGLSAIGTLTRRDGKDVVHAAAIRYENDLMSMWYANYDSGWITGNRLVGDVTIFDRTTLSSHYSVQKQDDGEWTRRNMSTALSYEYPVSDVLGLRPKIAFGRMSYDQYSTVRDSISYGFETFLDMESVELQYGIMLTDLNNSSAANPDGNDHEQTNSYIGLTTSISNWDIEAVYRYFDDDKLHYQDVDGTRIYMSNGASESTIDASGAIGSVDVDVSYRLRETAAGKTFDEVLSISGSYALTEHIVIQVTNRVVNHSLGSDKDDLGQPQAESTSTQIGLTWR